MATKRVSAAPGNGSSHQGHLPSSGRALAISAWLTGIDFIIELAVGLYTGSIAVISDAFHTSSTVGGALVASLAARIARRPVSPAKTFGWCRCDWPGADTIAGDGKSGHHRRRSTLSRGDPVCDMCWIGQGVDGPVDHLGGRFTQQKGTMQ